MGDFYAGNYVAPSSDVSNSGPGKREKLKAQKSASAIFKLTVRQRFRSFGRVSGLQKPELLFIP